MRRFIVELLHGHWTAWEVPRPEVAFGGDAPAVALGRLFDNLGVDHSRVEGGFSEHGERLEFVIPDAECPECGGTGKYVGLNAVEVCERCGGLGNL